jgi:hypothetical protein
VPHPGLRLAPYTKPMMSTQSSFSASLKWPSRILARFSLLVMGADALAPAIVEWIWGQDDVVRRNLGNPRGDLAIIQFCWHVWLTTTTPSICGSPPPFGGVNSEHHHDGGSPTCFVGHPRLPPTCSRNYIHHLCW